MEASAVATRCAGGAAAAGAEAAGIAASTPVMEDYLLRNARASAGGARALGALQSALECSPRHAKAWYRYGFLMHRHAALPHAALAALKHALLLRPDSGPAYAELPNPDPIPYPNPNPNPNPKQVRGARRGCAAAHRARRGRARGRVGSARYPYP